MIAPGANRRRRPAAGLASLGALAAALASGCLSVPEGPAVMCSRSSDCDQAASEVCEENVCWGNPPAGMFAAVAAPPSTRRDLVSQELPMITLEPDGTFAPIVLQTPKVLSGRVVGFCASPTAGCGTALDATITVSRDSQFQGGPGFKATINSDAETFSVPVPGGTSGDAMFSVTVVPSDDPLTALGQSPAKLVPPARFQLTLSDTLAAKNVVLGGPTLPVISGALKDSLGQGLAGYRVSVLGRWVATESATEVSSVAITDTNGAYSVTLSDGLVDTVELVARPPSDIIAPMVHVTNIEPKSSQRSVTQPESLGVGIPVYVQVTGADLGGATVMVPGAVVTVSGSVVANAGSSFTVSDQQVANDKGIVTLHLLDGEDLKKSYQMSIIPPPSSTLGVMFDQPIVIPPTSSTPDHPIVARLGSRVALSGVVLDASGAPIDHVAVTARPSLRFLWTLEPAPQAFVAAIPVATAVTLDTGKFVLWVDPRVEQVWGDYDLVIEPPATRRAPTYIKRDVAIASDGPVLLEDITLPDAAFVHGEIFGPDGTPIENAELRLYLVSSAQALCTEFLHAPASCPIPAQLEGRNTSDAKGTIRLTLPR
jgi:hypothetical protein